MSTYTYLRELIDGSTQSAGRQVFRLDADRWNSFTVQGLRTTGAPVTLEVHVDVSSRNNPDVTEATGSPAEWSLDYVASADLAAAAQTRQSINPDVHVPRWIRVRIEFAGIDTDFRINVDAKGDTASR